MHERVSVSGLNFPDDDLATALGHVADLGVSNTTVQASKIRAFGWERGLATLASSAVHVAAIVDGAPPFELGSPDRWDARRESMIASLDAAAALRARSVYVLTGSLLAASGEVAPWDDAAAAFAAAIEPVAAHARSVGVGLAVEATSPLYADLSIVHSLSDAQALFERCDVGVCVDLSHVWSDARLKDRLAALAGRIALVQVGDRALGERGLPSGAVLGDGVLPLRRFIRAVLAAGYDGPIDIEHNGPRIDAEGHAVAARRSAAYLTTVLGELGRAPQ